MGILDWFKNRQSQFDPDRPSDELARQAIEKAVALTNPRLKLVRAYQERLAPAVNASIRYLREMVLSVPPAIDVAAACWSSDPALRAFFVSATDIQGAFTRSPNLRTLFTKYPELDEAYFILVMRYSEQRSLGVSLQGEMIVRDVEQAVVGFSDHQVRICGARSAEVRRLLGTQSYEYLLAQALAAIADDRSERRQLEDTQALIRSRLRLFQQHGPGLGSVFGSAPAVPGKLLKLEAALLDNERQMEALGSPQSALERELETLREVLENPQRYLVIDKKTLRLSTMNVVVEQDSNDLASDLSFSLARLSGTQDIERAFVLGRLARSEMPAAKIDFAAAQRYL
jgi:hypothetical protein